MIDCEENVNYCEAQAKTNVTNANEAFQGMTPEQIKKELINQLVKKAKGKKNTLTYSDMAEHLDAFDLDKNVIDEIYDALLTKDIDITSEHEPGHLPQCPSAALLRYRFHPLH